MPAALVEAARGRWPEHEWLSADTHHGAFRLVLTAPSGPSLRAIQGRRGRERSQREAVTLRVLETSSFPCGVPRVIDGPLWSVASQTWLTLMTSVPGTATTDLHACGPDRLSAYADALRAIRATSSHVHDDLPPVRAWCGGELWPDIVQRDLVPLLSRAARSTAVERVESVIDVDHACIGGPAMALAPLVGFHGVSGVVGLGEPDEIRGAMLHRATLPLQVAAAARRAGPGSLRDHALSNFERRAVDGSLFDPHGERVD